MHLCQIPHNVFALSSCCVSSSSRFRGRKVRSYARAQRCLWAAARYPKSAYEAVWHAPIPASDTVGAAWVTECLDQVYIEPRQNVTNRDFVFVRKKLLEKLASWFVIFLSWIVTWKARFMTRISRITHYDGIGIRNRIFQHVGRLFLPGTVKNVSMSYSSIFERNLVELVDFAGSKFQRMANWPSFDFLIEAVGELHETGRLFHTVVPVLIFFIETGLVGHPLEFEPAKSTNPTINRFLSKIDQ